NTGRKDFWKVVLKWAPEWMRYLVYGFLGYALVNFLLFAKTAPSGGGGGFEAPASMWRGFSGHWMAFYFAALAILYSAARSVDASPRCVNGHVAPPRTSLCAQCGQPVLRTK